MNLSYKVGTFRDAGLEAKWTKTRSGAPVIVVRDPKADLAHQRNKWWMVDAAMFENMKKDGVRPAFLGCTLIADIFSLPI
jgi:hypothetical protein